MQIMRAALSAARSPPKPPKPPKPTPHVEFRDEDASEREIDPCDEDDDAPVPEGPEPDPVSDAVAYAEARSRRIHLQREVAMTIGLVPFPFTAAPFSNGWIGWVVFVNGVVCHGYGALMVDDRVKRWSANWDIAWNVGLSVYVNIMTPWQPYSAVSTITATAIWLANGGWQGVRSAGVHIVGVQWMLCALLFVYEYGSKEP